MLAPLSSVTSTNGNGNTQAQVDALEKQLVTLQKQIADLLGHWQGEETKIRVQALEKVEEAIQNEIQAIERAAAQREQQRLQQLALAQQQEKDQRATGMMMRQPADATQGKLFNILA